MSEQKKVRLGVIGCGGMARSHMGYFKNIPALRFTAAADVAPENLKKVTDAHEGVQTFSDGHQLIKSGLCDAILIGTPHYFHPEFAIAGFDAGLHVLTEKPIAVMAQNAQEMIDAHAKHPELKFGAMFQMRTGAKWKKVKQIISEGTLGELVRVTWVVTTWFRPQSYYDSGGWRATWEGEGGGVLLNQCPHNLDLLTWICGSPNRVSAEVALGKRHRIEVEDEVNAYMEWENGATGHFITTTGEAPGTDWLQIAGDKGRLTTGTGVDGIELILNETATSEFSRTSTAMFSKPQTDRIMIQPGGPNSAHEVVTRNFVNAILNDEPLIAPAAEGILGLELGNAMLMSGLQKKPVDIPTDRPAFVKLMEELIANSTFEKGQVKDADEVNMASSFHK